MREQLSTFVDVRDRGVEQWRSGQVDHPQDMTLEVNESTTYVAAVDIRSSPRAAETADRGGLGPSRTDGGGPWSVVTSRVWEAVDRCRETSGESKTLTGVRRRRVTFQRSVLAACLQDPGSSVNRVDDAERMCQEYGPSVRDGEFGSVRARRRDGAVFDGM